MDDHEKLTILIIDDKEANIYSLRTLLEKPGRSFLAATNGAEGLKLALNNTIDLIILDVQMPGMDGFEVAQTLKSSRRTREIPIIFASAEKKERQSILKGFEEGAVDYLSKPLDPEFTRAKVSVLLKIQSQKKELLAKNISLENAEARIKSLNTQLQSNLTQLETANRDLESFSYSVSHDLRAPLRSIIGYSEALQEDHAAKLDDDAVRLINVIQNNARRMNALIDDLLAFSKLGAMQIQKSIVNFDQLVNNVLAELHRAVPHNADIQLGKLETAAADYSLITQVWTNLISNAIKYSSKKEKPFVQIGCERTDGELIYFVRDNGAGFDMQYANKLFNAFQRLHKQDEFQGTGIGLALVYRIVSRHGGKVWAEGKVNEGASFYFSLPAGEASNDGVASEPDIRKKL